MSVSDLRAVVCRVQAAHPRIFGPAWDRVASISYLIDPLTGETADQYVERLVAIYERARG